VSNEELAIIMEYLYSRGVDKKRVKKAVDIWWAIKEKDKK
jgi:uncharacterized protein YggL (DUF469 family)